MEKNKQTSYMGWKKKKNQVEELTWVESSRNAKG